MKRQSCEEGKTPSLRQTEAGVIQAEHDDIARGAGRSIVSFYERYHMQNISECQGLKASIGLCDIQVKDEKRLCLQKQNSEWQGCKRGDISKFSKKSARRMRRFMCNMWVPGYLSTGCTLTSGPEYTAAEYRAMMSAMNMWCVRNDIAGVWRVELQERLVPHLHVLFYHENDYDRESIKSKWLDLVGFYIGHEKHACKFGSGMGARILFYVAMHNSKQGTQAGWKGRHWGYWNKKLFEPYPRDEIEISKREHVRLCRVVSNYCKSIGSDYRPTYQSDVFVIGLGAGLELQRLLSYCRGEDYVCR